jgi:peptide/nickel transport system substrate-binding protein
MGAWVSRRDFLVTTGVGVAGLATGRRAAAQDKKTLVVAWDSDIDNLDPAVFKSQGGYVTVANTTDAPIMWKVQPLEGEPGLKVFSVPDTTCHFLCMNQKKPPFDNKLVRQAVNYAIPIQAILPNVLFGYGVQMKSPVPNLTPSYLGDYSPYKYDIAKAKALMKEAGMDKAPIPVDLAVRVGWPTHEQASVWLQRELEQIGFKVNIVKETDATFRQLATKGDHQLSIEAWQSWINDPFYHLTFLFNSKSKFTNLSAYSNPAVDKLIDENMHETNRDKRAAASRDIQKLVLDDAVWGLLWYENWTRVGTSDLVGIEKRWDTFERYYGFKRT